MSRIPTILHQTWRTADLPWPFAAWRASWRKQHPDWDHRLYDDWSIRRTIADRAPQWLSTYEVLPRPIQRVDFFRYLIVYLDGGMYADIDTVSYLPCDPLLHEENCVLGIELCLHKHLQQELGYDRPWQLANFIFAAVPHNPLFGALLEAIARRATSPVQNDEVVQDLTGPRMLTRVAYELTPEHRGPVRILPQINWNAPWIYPRLGPLAKQIYARHGCFGSWRTQNPAVQRLWRGMRYRLPNPFSVSGPSIL
jgi:inositol phosphorylceramide mannosyltransferase catalytic subunit